MSNNKFSSLQASDSEDNDSMNDDAEEVEIQFNTISHRPIVEESNIPRQSGGLFVQRQDSSTGINDPSGIELNINTADIATATRVITAIGKNIHLFKLSKFKPLRAALHPLVVEQLKNYDTKNPRGRNNKRKQSGATGDSEEDYQKSQRQKIAALEEEYINQTQLRALRTRQLELLNQDGYAPRVPDGVAICDIPSCGVGLLTNASASDGSSAPAVNIKLSNPISCYICHKPYVDLHFFYHQLCPDCATFNFSKRDELADLHGKVMIVTGGRTKIGYRSALKLLRCGAHVIVTTRFPLDGAKRFALEKDSAEWLHRLDIFGLDFRDLKRLEEFCVYVIATYDRLDAIVNNACQTVRRPPAYYMHLMQDERAFAVKLLNAPSNDPMIPILKKQSNFSQCQFGDATSADKLITATDGAAANSTSSLLVQEPSAQSSISSVEMSQMIVVPGDDNYCEEEFPTGILDVNKQQVDLRKHNSWTMKLHEVTTPELAEVMAINAMAPTILNSRLKSLMEKDKTALKFIVNVSAMEGKFYRFKSDTHPHTNMAKAALNMMTRTSAQDYVKSQIYMTSVDTGWINDEKPIELAVAHEKKYKFQTPLDEIDAAARVLDPIIAPMKSWQQGEKIEPPWGIFLKDYMKCEW